MDILQGVNVRVEGATVIAKGPQGEVRKTFPNGIFVKMDGNVLQVSSPNKAIQGTIEAVLKNMMNGALNGYTRNLKLMYAHFPISVEIKGKEVAIKNFLGEKQARKTVIVGNTKVQAKGQAVTITGPDKEAVGQTLGNIRIAMKIKDKDSRVFQDGIYDAEG